MTADHRDFSKRSGRIAWADHAKGICIILVVLLYAVTEQVIPVAGNGGWLETVVEFARPVRMPGFFLVSGVLLTLGIDRDWRTFLDRKVVHFAYFYVLWLTLLVAFESPWIAAKASWSGVATFYLKSFVHPYSLLWFIYLLPIMFVVTKVLRRASPVPVWLLAAALQVAELETGIKVLDRFAAYYAFFYSGYLLAPHLLRLAGAVPARPMHALALLASWGVLDAWLVFGGYAPLPGISLALGLLGAAAVIGVAALMAETRVFAPVAYCGHHSIVVYLAFTIPLALAGRLLFSSGWIEDAGSIAVLATIAAIAGALALHRLVRDTALRFLFERPAWLRLGAAGPRGKDRLYPGGAEPLR